MWRLSMNFRIIILCVLFVSVLLIARKENFLGFTTAYFSDEISLHQSSIEKMTPHQQLQHEWMEFAKSFFARLDRSDKRFNEYGVLRNSMRNQLARLHEKDEVLYSEIVKIEKTYHEKIESLLGKDFASFQKLNRIFNDDIKAQTELGKFRVTY